jgi:hypothetical protein
MRVSPVLVLAVACTGGQGLKDGVYEDDDVRYRAHAPGDGWSEVVVSGADLAWHHDVHSASLLLNSHCQGVDDAPLEALTRHLVIGMTDRAIVAEHRFELSRREALLTTMSARLDGVERHLKILVVKKDGCVYDVVLAAAPADFARATPAFDAVVAALAIDARPGSG